MKIMQKFMVGLGLLGTLSGVGQAMWGNNQGFQQYSGYTQPVYVPQPTGYRPAEVWLTVAFNGKEYQSALIDIGPNWTKEQVHAALFQELRLTCQESNVPLDADLEGVFNPYMWHLCEFLYQAPHQRINHDLDGIRYAYTNENRITSFSTATQQSVQKGYQALTVVAEEKY